MTEIALLMHRSLFAGVILGVTLFAEGARAQAVDNDWDGGYHVVATRRSGFVASFSGGPAFGNADGYPNDLAKLDNVNYERNTKFGLGTANHLWIGGALTDWFVFGFGLTALNLRHENAKATGSAFTFHVQGYPLFYRGGTFRDLSLFGEFGAGGMKINGGSREEANGGLMSVIGIGAAWEPVRFWRFTFGPSVEYLQTWSQSMSAHVGLVEARLTFVGGP
ncbi:MAG TPA: hypothetical protein VHV51_24220 [Polyangiaceae bacterium]|nr:hypothetical protein [Polyangiaceae bacterium]